MRLIDADELIKGLKEDYDDIKVQKVLERLGIYTYIGTVQPTAYDVDKVIEQLDDLDIYFDNDYYTSNRETLLMKKEVMEVVKRGGIE
jgi:hypothetical protein